MMNLLQHFPDNESLTLSPTQPIPEALRRVLLRYFREMVENEPIARFGEDIEGVHKMRVGTRRMRSIYRTFGKYLPKRYKKPYLELLCKTASLLGEVRDLDVFMERTQKYVEDHLSGDPDSLTALIKLNHTEHQVARTQLLNWLNSPDYEEFVTGFFALLDKPLTAKHLQRHADLPFSFQVNHILPQVIYRQFNHLRRYETLLDGAEVSSLHEMRKEAKRLRYTVDAFSEVLGDPIKEVIAALKDLQDHLGDLNDASVGIERLSVAYDCVPVDRREGIIVYQNHFKAMLADKMEGTTDAWLTFNTPDLRRALALSITSL